MKQPLLEVRGFSATYETDDGIVRVLNDVDLHICEGESLGLVGETGAGKTTLAKHIMRLVQSPPGHIKGGEIVYDGQNLLAMTPQEMRKVRGSEIAMIFQDPMTSLNPVMQVELQIAEVIKEHEQCTAKEALKKAHDMLELVGIPAGRGRDYPHQFSGGMKQRVVIAIALACNPRLLIADEPTTALDVTIQAQVIEMINELKRQKNTAMMLITHDLGIVAQNCDKVAILYAGEIVESGTLAELFDDPRHPYTLGLFGSIPRLSGDERRLSPIEGLMPDPTDLPSGCHFHPRCKKALPQCSVQVPPVVDLGGAHRVRCVLCQDQGAKEASQ